MDTDFLSSNLLKYNLHYTSCMYIHTYLERPYYLIAYSNKNPFTLFHYTVNTTTKTISRGIVVPTLSDSSRTITIECKVETINVLSCFSRNCLRISLPYLNNVSGAHPGGKQAHHRHHLRRHYLHHRLQRRMYSIFRLASYFPSYSYLYHPRFRFFIFI